MTNISYTPAAGTQSYDTVFVSVRWSGKPLRFWYAHFMDIGDSKPISCVKAVGMRFGLGPVPIYSFKSLNARY